MSATTIHSDPHGPAEPPAPPTPPEPNRRASRHFAHVVWGLVAAVVCFVLLAVLALYAAAQTERGTRFVWRAACDLSGGLLSGAYRSGTLAHGMRLTQVAWHTPQLSVELDEVAGAWSVTRAPWRLTVDFLHVGTLAIRQSAAPDHAPAQLPARLTLPLQLAVHGLRVDHLRWSDGLGPAASTTELDHLALHGNSDGQHHALTLDSVSTAYGSLSGSVGLDGIQPFKLSAALGFAGQVAAQPVELSARVSGTLQHLTADLDANGRQLSGRAHVEAMPFDAVPLKIVTLAADHVNLQAFDPSAPAADLSLRARLAPVISPTHGAAATGLVVAGPVSIVNAQAGLLSAHQLPLLDAQAQIRLDAHQQSVSGLQLRFFKGGSLSGGGSVADGHGQFDLQVTGLDLNLLDPQLRSTRLNGPLSVKLTPTTQQVALDLADPQAGVRLRTTLHTDAKQLAIDSARLDAGAGHLDLSGALRRDSAGSYALQADLIDFDPLAVVLAQVAMPQAKPARAAHAPREPVAPRADYSRASAPVARVSGAFALQGSLAQATVKANLTLRESSYDGLPLTGGGTVQWQGRRLLPSRLALSIAGNQLNLQGGFGAPGDSLAFHLDAQHLDRLGLGLAGTALADGRITGTLSHPNVTAHYSAAGLAFGVYHLGQAKGQAELHDGANGALAVSVDATELNMPGVALHTLAATLSGTRANHSLTAQAVGTVHGQPVDLAVAAHGKLTDSAAGSAWDGVVTQAVNRGLPDVQLLDPLSVSVANGRLALGGARFTLAGASLELRQFLFDHGKIQSAGTLHNLDVDRILRIRQDLTGTVPPLKTDLQFDGDWDFTLGQQASGYLQIQRHSGDIVLNTWRGASGMGFTALSARLDFAADNRANLVVKASAARIGTATADLHTQLRMQDGSLALLDEAPLSGSLQGTLPQLRTTGGLFGPAYVLDGSLQVQLKLAGVLAHPQLSGTVSGKQLSATLIDQGIQFKQGVIQLALDNNTVRFEQVEFHGASGTLSASGQIKLDEANPDLAVKVVADKLELFATPDRQLQISGQAAVRNRGTIDDLGGLAIDGEFKVDHALFDLPESPEPTLGSDVHIVKQDGTEVNAQKPSAEHIAQQTEKPAGALAPQTHIAINLGDAFRFKGAGADLTLHGQLVATSSPKQPLRAVGNVTVGSGSTYTAFGRKLSIDSGFFTFNGPIDNPGINITAMRHNQEVEAGVQVSGTVQAPVAKLVSEPTVADNEKLSWLLFGHGTDSGPSLGQQSTMTEAFALLGNAGGKRIAQTLGLDELSIGQSEVGLTDPQVVTLSKAINERFVLGYEQGLTTAASVFKVTWNLSRFWSVALHTGAVNGATLLYNRRFD